MNEYWQRQTINKALFPNLLWSRPENRQLAGKLLIAGGNAQGFAAPAEGYAAAQKAGVGVCRVMLPDSLAKTLGRSFEAGEFAPSTPSGSFSRKALAELLDTARWADGVLLDGDMGRNSETAILLESFAAKYHGLLTVTSDTADYFLQDPEPLLDREQTLLVLDFPQLQRLFTGAHEARPVTSGMDLIRFVEALHLFSLRHAPYVAVRFNDLMLAAVAGKVSSTPFDHSAGAHWQSRLAAQATVWWLQHPSQPYEALTTAMLPANKL